MGLRKLKKNSNGSEGDGSDPNSPGGSNEEEKVSLENRFPISNDDFLEIHQPQQIIPCNSPEINQNIIDNDLEKANKMYQTDPIAAQ